MATPSLNCDLLVHHGNMSGVIPGLLLGERLPGPAFSVTPETGSVWHRRVTRRAGPNRTAVPDGRRSMRGLRGYGATGLRVARVLKDNGIRPADRRAGAHVASLPASAGIASRGHRLLHRGNAHAQAALRALVHRSRAPTGVDHGLYRPSARCLGHPTERNITADLEDEGVQIAFLLRDRDTKYVSSFNIVYTGAGAQILRTPYRTPNANAHAERFMINRWSKQSASTIG